MHWHGSEEDDLLQVYPWQQQYCAHSRQHEALTLPQLPAQLRHLLLLLPRVHCCAAAGMQQQVHC
jgi:hypothetical protein